MRMILFGSALFAGSALLLIFSCLKVSSRESRREERKDVEKADIKE